MNSTIARLQDLMNRHDVHEMASLFSPDYRSEQPAHPNRGFGGAAQVEANWSEMFAGVPDMRLECLAETVDGSTAWTEWRWTGTHPDGTPFGMAGVVVFTLADDGRIAAARLYMEPVEQDGAAIEDAVHQLAQTVREP
jgi:SnoaL-like domain